MFKNDVNAVCINNKKIQLFMFVVKQNIGVAVSTIGTIENTIPENCEINQVTHNDKFYFIATSQGLYIYSRVNVNSTQHVCTGEITDLLINKNTLYFIRKNDYAVLRLINYSFNFQFQFPEFCFRQFAFKYGVLYPT